MNNTPDEESIQSSVNLNETPEQDGSEEEDEPEEIKHPNLPLNKTPEQDGSEEHSVNLNETPEEDETEEIKQKKNIIKPNIFSAPGSKNEEEEEDEEEDEDEEEEEEEDEEEEEEEEEEEDEKEEEEEEEEDEEEEEKSFENEQSINSKNKTIHSLKNNCKLKTLTSDFYKKRLNEGDHKCIHKKPIEKDKWHVYFKKRSTSLITFGLNKQQNEKKSKKNEKGVIRYLPSVQCNYFLLSLLLKDCDTNKYKGQYNLNYINDIKKYLIDGYRNLLNDANAPLILKKWQKYGRKEDTISIMKSSRKYIESFEFRINHPMYRLCIIDFVIFMAYYNIPILLIYQSKKTETSNGIKLLYMMDSTYYYIIKVHNQTFEIKGKIREVNVFDLHLWSNGRQKENRITTIRFSKNKDDEITPKLRAEINKEKNLYTFEEYLNKPEL